MDDQLPFFVYGTLKPGQANYRRLLAGYTHAERPAVITGAALYTDGVYPYMVAGQPYAGPLDRVTGWLVAVRPEVYGRILRRIDWLEDYRAGRADNIYERVVLTAHSDGSTVVAWCYVAGPPVRERIRARLLRRCRASAWPV